MKFTLFKKDNEICLKSIKKKIKKTLQNITNFEKQNEECKKNSFEERQEKIEEKLDYLICIFERIIEKINN